MKLGCATFELNLDVHMHRPCVELAVAYSNLHIIVSLVATFDIVVV